MSFTEQVRIRAADSPTVDAFSRLRVSNPTTLFDSTFLYDKQPLVFEEITTGGASATHIARNSAVTLATSGVGTEEAVLQAYRRARYRPGKSHLVAITFKFGAGAVGVTKEVGLNDDENGVLLQQSGATLNMIVRSSSDAPTETVPQASWNIDQLNGSGPSGIDLDITKTHILVMDMQWLGVGRVRVGFDIDGIIVPVHEFLHANVSEYVYTRNLVLPIRYRVSTVDTVGSMDAICSSVMSEGGAEDQIGYTFSQNAMNVVAGNGVDTHVISLRPKKLFNGVKNTNEFRFRNLSLFAAADQPVYWQLVIGATITTPTWVDVNSTYSSTEYDISGTLVDTVNGIIVKSGYLAGGGKSGTTGDRDISLLYPLSLDRAGNNRDLGTLTLIVRSIGTAAGSVNVSIDWTELR